ncbi:Asd/ArgC dimerization domain-containing protein [Tolumonas lignilytica]|uniref:Asd/ArgC dimerization domain-containing protein n=1 Tax=Tolumonas lignilytica TaxID=1283284 RepID=UPI0004664D9F|nr:Asd/ArgC dimerization domain-containing protein [Tolumonas lignilytica]
MPMNIAIAGSEELISESLLELLQEKALPIGQMFLLTAQNAEDQESIRFNNKTVYVQELDSFDWSQVNLVFFVGNSSEYNNAFKAALHYGCKIIDLRSGEYKDSSHGLSLLDQNINLNTAVHVCPDDLAIVMAQIIMPFFEETAITQLNLVALEPVSVCGKKGTEALARETAQLMNGRPLENTLFPAQLAFNVVPEQKTPSLIAELQILFPKEKLNAAVTLLQVPVFYGTTVIADITLEDALPQQLVREMLSSVNQIELTDELLTPVSHGSNQNKIYAQFITGDSEEIQTFRLFLVTDLLRCGRVQNAISLAEQLLQ